MWKKISDSILFYSDNFYNNNLYKDTQFIKQLYFYYKNKGFKTIILTQIINIIISIFLFVFILFLFNSVDYNTLFKVNNYTKLSSTIHFNTLLKFNAFFICLFISFILFILTKILNLIELFYKYNKIKHYYNTNLKINDNELDYIKWDDIINKLELYNNETIDIYKINSIILFYENYLNAIFDNNIIQIHHLTNLMEWNIQYCILFKMFDKSELNLETKKKNIYLRLRIISIINFIFMPFILVFILFYNIFNYGEEFYSKPTLLITRIFTKKSLWKWKYYNELPHDFESRISKIIPISNQYINQFKNDYINSLSKLIVFMCSSFFIILVLLSIANDKILLYITIFNNKSILWLISILASLITLFKSNKTIDNEPKYYMKDISNIIYLDQEFVDDSNAIKTKNKFATYFQYKIIIIIKDIIYTILTPFRLWLLGNNVENICNFIESNISNNGELNICKMSNFDNATFNALINNNYEISKTYKSLEYFNELYPKWYNYMINKVHGKTNEIRVNVI
jgi:autophagy-related protein 9